MPARRSSQSVITVSPLTPGRWPDVMRLFGDHGACAGCWCMWWRQSAAEFKRNQGAANKRAFRRLVSSGAIPGLLAYRDGEPVGWCAVGPREDYPRMENSRVLKRVDDQPVWSISCLFVARGRRRQGVSEELIKGAVDFARRRKARILEGYPKDTLGKDAADAFVWTGLASAYRRAGFTEVLRRSATRPIMRYDLRPRQRVVMVFSRVHARRPRRADRTSGEDA